MPIIPVVRPENNPTRRKSGNVPNRSSIHFPTKTPTNVAPANCETIIDTNAHALNGFLSLLLNRKNPLFLFSRLCYFRMFTIAHKKIGPIASFIL